MTLKHAGWPKEKIPSLVSEIIKYLRTFRREIDGISFELTNASVEITLPMPFLEITISDKKRSAAYRYQFKIGNNRIEKSRSGGVQDFKMWPLPYAIFGKFNGQVIIRKLILDNSWYVKNGRMINDRFKNIDAESVWRRDGAIKYTMRYPFRLKNNRNQGGVLN